HAAPCAAPDRGPWGLVAVRPAAERRRRLGPGVVAAPRGTDLATAQTRVGDDVARARRARPRHAHARRRPDDGELVPRLGRVGARTAAARALVPGGRGGAD